MKKTIRIRSNIKTSTTNIGTDDNTVEITYELDSGEEFNLEAHRIEYEKIQTQCLISNRDVMKEMKIIPASENEKKSVK